ADFVVKPAAAPEPDTIRVGARAGSQRRGAQVHHAVALDGNGGAVTGLTVLAILGDGNAYVPGSAKLDGAPLDDPQLTGGFATCGLPGAAAEWRRVLAFDTPPDACDGDGGSIRFVTRFSAGDGTARTAPATSRWSCDGPPDPDP